MRQKAHNSPSRWWLGILSNLLVHENLSVLENIVLENVLSRMDYSYRIILQQCISANFMDLETKIIYSHVIQVFQDLAAADCKSSHIIVNLKCQQW